MQRKKTTQARKKQITGRPINSASEIEFAEMITSQSVCINLVIMLMQLFYLRFGQKESPRVATQQLKELFASHSAEDLYQTLLSGELGDYELTPAEQKMFSSSTDILFLVHTAKEKLGIKAMSTNHMLLLLIAYLHIHSAVNEGVLEFFKKRMRSRQLERTIQSAPFDMETEVQDAKTETLIQHKMSELISWISDRFNIQIVPSEKNTLRSK